MKATEDTTMAAGQAAEWSADGKVAQELGARDSGGHRSLSSSMSWMEAAKGTVREIFAPFDAMEGCIPGDSEPPNTGSACAGVLLTPEGFHGFN